MHYLLYIVLLAGVARADGKLIFGEAKNANGGAIVVAPAGKTVFAPGKAGVPVPGQKLRPTDGELIFSLASGKEMLRFDPNGDCFVRGEKVESNKAIWIAFHVWLKAVNIYRLPAGR